MGGGVIKIYPGYISISDDCEEDINCSEKTKVEYYDEYPQQSEFADYISYPTVTSSSQQVEYDDDDDYFGEESDTDSEEYYSVSSLEDLDDYAVHAEEDDENAADNFPPHILPADSDCSDSFNDNYEQIVLESLPCNTQLDFTVSRKIIYD
ncbi:hypothetical protein FRX31_008067 [Thalictrum thalictroides]|uniref:Uncharacterized protein n=1 Tax=Thalictrum thalictroides TaxID=46969 RepID=A0A7J6WY12_THATH|nr:hypothetical protein FRX31_008067 [Thalictrum thalictroides]